MDFCKPPAGLVAPMPPAKLSVPADDPADDAMLITEPVLGPSEPIRPATPNPMSVTPPGIDPGGSLAAELCWRTPKTAE